MPDQIRVGIDVDGVLRDFGTQFAKLAKIFYNVTVTADDYEEWGFKDVVDANGDMIIQKVFTNKDLGRFQFQKAPTYDFAKLGYDQFVNDPMFQTLIVTNQKDDYEVFTDKWMDRYNFTHHHKTYYEQHKLQAPAQVLIDDKPENVNQYVENGRDALMIVRPYNDHIDVNDRVMKASDVPEAYEILRYRYARSV